jgi:hypothetical protein
MLDHEWPARKAAFEAWLSPDNFDPDGRQHTRLLAMHDPVSEYRSDRKEFQG